MPLYHCVKCHHEWEGIKRSGLEPICDWCGAHGFILEEKTPLEKMLDEMDRVGIDKFLKTTVHEIEAEIPEYEKKIKAGQNPFLFKMNPKKFGFMNPALNGATEEYHKRRKQCSE
jgi:hypothetical protein